MQVDHRLKEDAPYMMFGENQNPKILGHHKKFKN